MPKELESCMMKVMEKGHDEKSAYAICKSSMDMKEKEGMDAVIKYACDMADEKKKFAQLNSISGVEIFASGEWNGDNYSEADLDRLVYGFNETKNVTKPYLKLGHGQKQSLLSKDELPAAGFVDKIYRSGKKILADFVNIPSKIYELIKNKAYNKVSSEIFVNFKSNGKTYPFALKAVALLGGETPAVHSLNDILALYSHEIGEKTGDDLVAEVVKAYEFDYSSVNTMSKEDAMTIEEMTRQNAKLEAEVKSFQEEAAALEKDLKLSEDNLKVTQAQAKEYKDKLEVSQKEIQTIKKEAMDKEIETEVKAFCKEGKIVPAQEPFLIALLKNVRMNEDTKVFSINEKEYKDVKSLVRAFIDAQVKQFNEEEEHTSERGKVSYSDADLDLKIRKYAEEKKVSYKEAYLALSPSGKPEVE